MIDILKIILIVTIILGVIVTERYSTEKDTIRQLITQGRTNFVFCENISASNITVIKDNNE